MSALFGSIGVCALGLPALERLRLFRFRSQTLRVVTQDLAYEAAVPGFQGPVFNLVTKQVRTTGGNNYDAAIAFVLLQLGAFSKPLSDKSRTFRADKLQRIRSLVESSNHGDQMVEAFLLRQQGDARSDT